jgi:hypothetical protein
LNCGDTALLQQLASTLACLNAHLQTLALFQERSGFRHYLRYHYGDHTFEHV